jgi:hypothetical protein
MKNIFYLLMKNFGGLITNGVYTNILFLLNCLRLKKPFYFIRSKGPRTFNEKINYIKFNVKNPLSPIVADKYKVRKYVIEKIGSEYLVPIINVCYSFDDIKFDELPKQFVIKLNNGSGFNYICLDKTGMDIPYVNLLFQNALETDVFQLSREWHYKEIEPKIVIEELIGENIIDYKFFCNQNGPFLVQVDIDRFTNHKRNLYDLNWNLMPIKLRYDNSQKIINQPKKWKDMIQIATKLSADFVFCRVDLYEMNDRVLFGEITLHPGGGLEPFDCYKTDLMIGEFIQL